ISPSRTILNLATSPSSNSAVSKSGSEKSTTRVVSPVKEPEAISVPPRYAFQSTVSKYKDWDAILTSNSTKLTLDNCETVSPIKAISNSTSSPISNVFVPYSTPNTEPEVNTPSLAVTSVPV